MVRAGYITVEMSHVNSDQDQLVVGAGNIAVEMAQVNSRSLPSSGRSWIYCCRDEPC